MSFLWHQTHMAPFLEAYRAHPCLWDAGCSGYGDRNLRDKALAQIVADMNVPDLTIGAVRAKIKSVRSQYGAELQRIKDSERSGTGVADVYKPRLFWFPQADAFLRPSLIPRASSSNLQGARLHNIGKVERNGKLP